MIFELAQDFADVIEAMPVEHPRHKTLSLLDEAIHRDIHFIDRHPTTMFQCMWNTSWWYDSPEAAEHYEKLQEGWQEPPPWDLLGEKLSTLLANWRMHRLCDRPWLRSLRPPVTPLGTPLIAAYRGHRDSVMSVAVSPDGQRIVSSSADRTVRTWDSKTGRQLLELRGHSDVVGSVAVSPDSSRVYSGSLDGTVRIWDINTGQLLLELGGAEVEIYSIGCSPCGRYVAAGGNNGRLRVWDTETGIQTLELIGHTARVLSTHFSFDGKQLISSGSSDRTVRTWDTQTGELNQELAFDEFVANVAIFPDGQRCVTTHGSNARVIDIPTGQELHRLKVVDEQYCHLAMDTIAVSPDGEAIASGGFNGPVRIWDASKGTLLGRLDGNEAATKHLVFSADGRRVVSCSRDMTIRVWDAARRHLGARRLQLEAQREQRGIAGLVASNDGHTLILWEGVDDNPVIWILDTATLKVRAQLKGHTRGITDVALSSDGRWLVSGSIDMSVRVWDIRRLEQTWDGNFL